MATLGPGNHMPLCALVVTTWLLDVSKHGSDSGGPSYHLDSSVLTRPCPWGVRRSILSPNFVLPAKKEEEEEIKKNEEKNLLQALSHRTHWVTGDAQNSTKPCGREISTHTAANSQGLLPKIQNLVFFFCCPKFFQKSEGVSKMLHRSFVRGFESPYEYFASFNEMVIYLLHQGLTAFHFSPLCVVKVLPLLS